MEKWTEGTEDLFNAVDKLTNTTRVNIWLSFFQFILKDSLRQLIAENIIAQVDEQGHKHHMFEEMSDYRVAEEAI